MLSDVQKRNLIGAGIALALVVVIVILSVFLGGKRGGSNTSAGAAHMHMHSKTVGGSTDKICSIVKDAAHWTATAAQDQNATLAVVHSTYGAAYLNVARQLASDQELESNCNLRLDELGREIQSVQQKALRALATACPSVTPTGVAALHTGWLSGGM